MAKRTLLDLDLQNIQSMVDRVKHDREVSIDFMFNWERIQRYKKEGIREGIQIALQINAIHTTHPDWSNEQIAAESHFPLEQVNDCLPRP